ncbi:MAG: hypothetical protein GX446_11965, partial [Chthonomonadales bacterium]|nr:hypothetical protein [Chthonomonadales bacterium]
MRKVSFIITVLLALAAHSRVGAQGGTAIVYSSFFGGNGWDHMRHIVVDGSGYLYFAGISDSSNLPVTSNAYDQTHNGGDDVFVAKLSPDGSTIVYCTYLGGSGRDYALSLAVDARGCAYVTGRTESRDFPTTPGALQPVYGGSYDVYVTKLSPDGSSLVYSTYIARGDQEVAEGIAVTSAGEAVLHGFTYSRDFPVTAGAYDTTFAGSGWVSDAFVLKLSADGSTILASTLLGGPSTEEGRKIALDPEGYVYVVGNTNGGFPTTEGAYDTTFNGGWGWYQDGYVAKLSPDLSTLVWSTYIGGSNPEIACRVRVLPDRSVVVCVMTGSADFPTTPGAYDRTYNGGSGDIYSEAAVLKLSADGSTLIFSTYIGGSGRDTPNGLDVAPDGSIWVGMETHSPDYPVTPDRLPYGLSGGLAAAVTRLSADGSGLLYSTFINGSNGSYASPVAVGPNDAVFVAGDTWSADFPTTDGAFDTTFNGGERDTFVLKLRGPDTTPPKAFMWAVFQVPTLPDPSNRRVYVYARAVDEQGGSGLSEGSFKLGFSVNNGAMTWLGVGEQVADGEAVLSSVGHDPYLDAFWADKVGGGTFYTWQTPVLNPNDLLTIRLSCRDNAGNTSASDQLGTFTDYVVKSADELLTGWSAVNPWGNLAFAGQVLQGTSGAIGRVTNLSLGYYSARCLDGTLAEKTDLWLTPPSDMQVRWAAESGDDALYFRVLPGNGLFEHFTELAGLFPKPSVDVDLGRAAAQGIVQLHVLGAKDGPGAGSQLLRDLGASMTLRALGASSAAAVGSLGASGFWALVTKAALSFCRSYGLDYATTGAPAAIAELPRMVASAIWGTLVTTALVAALVALALPEVAAALLAMLTVITFDVGLKLTGQFLASPATAEVAFVRAPTLETTLLVNSARAEGLAGSPPKLRLGEPARFAVEATNTTPNPLLRPWVGLDIVSPDGVKLENTLTPIADGSEGGTGQVGRIDFGDRNYVYNVLNAGTTYTFRSNFYTFSSTNRPDLGPEYQAYWADTRPYYVRYSVWHTGYPGQSSPVAAHPYFEVRSVPFYITDTTPPAQPRELQVKWDDTYSAALLTWMPPGSPSYEDRLQWDVNGYEVYRAGSTQGPAKVADIAAGDVRNEAACMLALPFPSGNYYVRAKDTGGNLGALAGPVFKKAHSWVYLGDVPGSSGSTVNLIATLDSGDGFLENRELSFYVDDTLVGTQRTGALGRASLPYVLPTLPEGTTEKKMTLRVTWAGDAVSVPSEASSTIHVGVPKITCTFESLTRDADGKLRLRVRFKNVGTAAAGPVT